MFGRPSAANSCRSRQKKIEVEKLYILKNLAPLFIACSIGLCSLAFAVTGDTRPAEYATADRKLNETYGAIVKKIQPSDREYLKKAQRIWIQMREADCKWASPREPLDCMIDRTVNRTEELGNSVFEAADGKYKLLDTVK